MCWKTLELFDFQRIEAEWQKKIQANRQRSLGCMKFIGQMYLQKMLTVWIIHGCIKNLIEVE
jgi:hypothetical protein